jgi:hypothetical protein
LLHDELARLPEKYRAPVLLCFFEGLTQVEAARRLGWPAGTVAGRLARAKQVLAHRLSARGVGLTTILLPTVGGGFVESTARAAVRFAGRQSPEVSSAVLELANREVRAMIVRRAFVAAAAVAVCGTLVLGLALTADTGGPAGTPSSVPVAGKPPVVDGPDETPGQNVTAAREKAVKFLKAQQTPQGHWEGYVLNFLADMEGGATALVTLSLLEAGVPADDPAVKKALDYLAKLPPKKTYVVSLQTQVLAKADPKKWLPQIQKNADWLLDTAIGWKQSGRLDGWSYPANATADGSNTHFAVFALDAAAGAGARVDAAVWAAVRDHYVRTRKAGGWAYHDATGGSAPATESMTAAALAGLALATHRHRTPSAAGGEAFERGMSSFVGMPAGTRNSTGYLWLVTAELGRATGAAVFKSGGREVAWYKDGAARLVRDQRPDGSWVAGNAGIDKEPVLNTAFGLYFLGPPGK